MDEMVTYIEEAGVRHLLVALSASGHTPLARWLWLPAKMTAIRWCRFDFETACSLAERHVNDRKINGRTWAEWQARPRHASN